MEMRRPSVEDMLKNRTTRYSLVCAVAKRAREIAEEMAEKEIISDEQPVLLALSEFEKGKYSILEPNINK
ncbi:MAG: DNA-directed RNA polymerase subunit omega [Acutalibacteraceae bacterium]